MPFAHFVWLVLCWGVMVLECLWLIQLVASWGVVLMLACDVVNRPALSRSGLDMPFAHFACWLCWIELLVCWGSLFMFACGVAH